MAERMQYGGGEPDGYVEFFATGATAKGDFHCAECGYGVIVHRELPTCPMCSGTAWEQVPWSPLTRALGVGASDPLPL